MYYTGFADEAAPDIDGQIRATKALGWGHIESRNIDGENITVGISIGIATFPADGTEPQVLVAAADQDMFRNKKERKPRSENSQNLLPFRKTESN